ncbi:MAG: glycosyltransferase [Acidimicrobiales bacterium]
MLVAPGGAMGVSYDRADAVLVLPQAAPTSGHGGPRTDGGRPRAITDPSPLWNASVIIPTHNDGANVAPLLDRVLAEPCVGDVVVVASACTDDTVPTVLGNRDSRVRLFVEEERSGKAAAVNFGLEHTTLDFVVVISGDVLPEAGAIGLLVDALQPAGVGLAGGRPVPVNAEDTPVGHAAHLLWRMHHRLASHTPKLGEMIGLRASAVVALPRTSVDEACFQALLENQGWTSVYVPSAVVANRGPGTVGDFVRQRRQIHAGHLWLAERHAYQVPSMRPGLMLFELLRDLLSSPTRLRPTRLAWTAGTVVMELCARALARVDYLRGRENHVWAMVPSTKSPALDAHGMVAGSR